jgi:hypothetical protein
MFRQIAPDGVVKKEAVDKSLSPDEALGSNTAVEIDQKSQPAETTLPVRLAASPTEDTEKHFAKMDADEAVAPYMNPTGEPAEKVDVEKTSDQAERAAKLAGGCPFGFS